MAEKDADSLFKMRKLKAMYKEQKNDFASNGLTLFGSMFRFDMDRLILFL